MNIVFASANHHKIREIAHKLGLPGGIRGLHDIGCTEEIAETGSTLQENAFIKASYVSHKYHVPCFADDTGLEVEALGNEPGVHSARYAGEGRSAEANMEKLLQEMRTVVYRKARFRTVICLIRGEEVRYFEGIVNGHITREKRGSEGFGYDPVFVPQDSSRTFAEMSIFEKNLISHRARAFAGLREYLGRSGMMSI